MNFETKHDLRKKIKRILADFHKNLSESQKSEITQNLFEKITALSEYKNAKIVLAYIPTSEEADCLPVILDALKSGKKVAVPKVDVESMKTGENRMDFYFLEKDCPIEDQLETGAYGIKEPKDDLEKFFGDFKGCGSGTAFTETRSKPVSQVLSANAVAPYPLGEGVAEDREAGWSEGETSPFDGIFVIVPGVAFTRGGKRLGHGKGFYDIYIEEMRKAGLKPFLCGIALVCQIVENLPTDEHDAKMDTILFCETQNPLS